MKDFAELMKALKCAILILIEDFSKKFKNICFKFLQIVIKILTDCCSSLILSFVEHPEGQRGFKKFEGLRDTFSQKTLRR